MHGIPLLLRHLESQYMSPPPTPPPRPHFHSLHVPRQQAAVVQQGFLHVDATVVLCGHGATIVSPVELN